MTRTTTMDPYDFAERIMSFFPDGLGDIARTYLDDAVYEEAYQDYDLGFDDDADEDEIAADQAGHAKSIIKEGPVEEILYLLHQGTSEEDIINMVTGGEGLSAHQQVELVATKNKPVEA